MSIVIGRHLIKPTLLITFAEKLFFFHRELGLTNYIIQGTLSVCSYNTGWLYSTGSLWSNYTRTHDTSDFQWHGFFSDYLLFMVAAGAHFQVFISVRIVCLSGFQILYPCPQKLLWDFFPLKFWSKIFSYSIVIVIYL